MATDLQARLREAMEGVTPGKWEKFPTDRIAQSEGRRYGVQSLKGPIVADCGEPGNTFSRANASYIALCSPDNIGSLLDHIDALSARNQELEGALERASITVKRYRRAGLGDDVFHSDLCEADKAIDKALAARSALGRNAG
ncbi:MAG: ead/Ea22-like family protein [Rhizobiaceae bacterium]